MKTFAFAIIFAGLALSSCIGGQISSSLIPIHPGALQVAPEVAAGREFEIFVDYDDPCGSANQETLTASQNADGSIEVQLRRWNWAETASCPATLNIVRTSAKLILAHTGIFKVTDAASPGVDLGSIVVVDRETPLQQWIPKPNPNPLSYLRLANRNAK